MVNQLSSFRTKSEKLFILCVKPSREPFIEVFDNIENAIIKFVAYYKAFNLNKNSITLIEFHPPVSSFTIGDEFIWKKAYEFKDKIEEMIPAIVL